MLTQSSSNSSSPKALLRKASPNKLRASRAMKTMRTTKRKKFLAPIILHNTQICQ